MGRDEIERLIRRYFRQSYFQDPSVFSDFVIDNITTYKAMAQGYWDIRTDKEIERDKQAAVTAADYEWWVCHELYLLKTTDQEN